MRHDGFFDLALVRLWVVGAGGGGLLGVLGVLGFLRLGVGLVVGAEHGRDVGIRVYLGRT